MDKTTRKSREPGWVRRISRRILGVPLIAKLIGANVVIVAVSIGVQVLSTHEANRSELVAVIAALAGASIVNVLLVRLALDPVRDLQLLANRVSEGEFDARGHSSPFADAQLARLTSTVNGLLDALAEERARIQALGAEVLFAQDAERARVSRELHDSIAQTLAAARFQVVAASAGADHATRQKLTDIRDLLASVMEHVRSVSNSLHPRVATDLGLESALRALAEQVRKRSGVSVSVSVSITGPPIPPNVSAMLFRVAEEALRNIEMHAFAESAKVDVYAASGGIRIEVVDDGCGFDEASVRFPAGRSGLAGVRDRVALAGGSMSVNSTPNGGTRVTAELKSLRTAS